MRVALLTSFTASRKEPLLAAMDRVHQAFLDAGLSEPTLNFAFGDGRLAGGVSSVDRVLKRYPELDRFVTTAQHPPQIPGRRSISNGPLSPAAGESVPYATLQAIATGVPRSFPFGTIALQFHSPEFGEDLPNTTYPEMRVGVLLSDNWWVNGRQRALSACTFVEAHPALKKLPPLPPSVTAVLAACGKIKRTIQAPLAGPGQPTPLAPYMLHGGTAAVTTDPEATRAVREIVLDYRARIVEIAQRINLPHDLPAPGDAYKEKEVQPGVPSGPKKPALEHAFKPMGYTCHGATGTFTLRRRTPSNLTVELYMDVGTWSHTVLAMFRVLGLGFKAVISLPVGARADLHSQYPVASAERWQQIVENYAALVAELDRTFVPAIEAATGPSPAWYQPET